MNTGKKIGYQLLGAVKVIIPIGAFIGGVFAMGWMELESRKDEREAQRKRVGYKRYYGDEKKNRR